MKRLIAATCAGLGLLIATGAWAAPPDASHDSAVSVPAQSTATTPVTKTMAHDDWSTNARTKCPDGSTPKIEGQTASCPQAGAARTEGAPLKGVDIKLGK
jgi:hypothetical protein